jgi:signal transduction histidine kinase
MNRPHIPPAGGARGAATLEQQYEYKDTRELVSLVERAAELIHTSGEAAFEEFRVGDSAWRHDETYIFVLDLDGNMLVHPDRDLEGRNTLGLTDVNGKSIIRGLIAAASAVPDRPEGWYHYQWLVPGGLLPRWKSSYVRLVQAPSGENYVVGSGMYNDRMERAFVVDLVTNAVAEIEMRGEAAFRLFHDPTGPYLAKDAYIFVVDMDGIELANPAFPSLRGRNLLDLKDTQGKPVVREMLELVNTRGFGWVDYMWPKPGESVSTRKSAYVSRAMLGDRPVLVACGVYLADAPKEQDRAAKLSAPKLRDLVRRAASLLGSQGEAAYAELRREGSEWLHDDIYLFVLTMDGIRAMHAAEPESEGRDDSALEDVLGRPMIRMMLEIAAAPAGEGWVHYMYPQPGSIFPAWKSTFVKRVTFPSGEQHVVGCGIYNMTMDESFIEDVVERAAALVAERGAGAFGELRDRRGEFIFMDTYVFVQTPDGTEMVNPGQPALEGRDLSDLKDLAGNLSVREEIAAAMNEGSAWVDLIWFRPGDNTPARKGTYVRRVDAPDGTWIVGSGIYVD